MEKKTLPKTQAGLGFCPLLQHGYQFEVDGTSKVCCLSKKQLSFEQLQPAKRVFQESWVEENCRHCVEVEERGGTSMRNIFLERFAGGFLETGKSRYFDIRLDNTCNLTCLMCSELYSSSWLKVKNHPMSVVKRDFEINELVDLVQPGDMVHFAGGEPFLVNQHLKMIEDWVRRGIATDIRLQFTTNMTFLSDSNLKQLRQYRSVLFCVSIESWDEINELIRKPAKNERIRQNLKKALALPNAQVVFQPTISLLNVFNLNSLASILGEIHKEFAVVVPIYAHPLFGPPFLDIQSAPIEVRKEVLEALEDSIDVYSRLPKQEDFVSVLRGLRKSMMDNPTPWDKKKLVRSIEGVLLDRKDDNESRILPILNLLDER